MSERKLDFTKGKVEVLTLDELKQTHVVNYPNGKPIGDIYHYDMIQFIMTELEEKNIPYQVNEIFAVDNIMKGRNGVMIAKEQEEQYGVGSLESHILNRVFANIGLFDDQRYNLAVSYTQQGIMVGFGPFVYACHNQTICRADHLVCNYGVRGMRKLEPKDRDLQIFMSNVHQKLDLVLPAYEEDLRMVEEMKDFAMETPQILQFIGALDTKRVLSDSTDKDIKQTGIYPIQDKDIHRLIEVLERDRLLGGCTAYALMQAANFYCKPGYAPFHTLLPQSLMIFNGLKSYMQGGEFDFYLEERK